MIEIRTLPLILVTVLAFGCSRETTYPYNHAFGALTIEGTEYYSALLIQHNSDGIHVVGGFVSDAPLGTITIGPNTRIGAGSVVVRDVEEDSTVVGIPGRVIHQSGVRINPLAHSALPDAEANVIRNLMERIDELETTVNALRSCLDDVATDCDLQDDRGGKAQSLKDREILEFLGESSG